MKGKLNNFKTSIPKSIFKMYLKPNYYVLQRPAPNKIGQKKINVKKLKKREIINI